MTGNKTIRVTPELAEQWLQWNKKNRPISLAHVRRLVREMEKGNWMLNGQALIFSDTGRLLDGQHRLTAVSHLGQSILMDVCFGVDPESFKTIDQGKKRTASDVISIKGFANYSQVAAAAKTVIIYDSTNKNVNSSDAKPSNSDILKWVEDNPSIHDEVTFALSLYAASDRLILTGSKLASYLFITRRISGDTDKFFTSLCTGIPMDKKNVIYLLRKVLIRAKLDNTRSLSRTVERGLVVTAWNKWKEGKDVKLLRFNPDQQKGQARFK